MTRRADDASTGIWGRRAGGATGKGATTRPAASGGGMVAQTTAVASRLRGRRRIGYVKVTLVSPSRMRVSMSRYC